MQPEDNLDRPEPILPSILIMNHPKGFDHDCESEIESGAVSSNDDHDGAVEQLAVDNSPTPNCSAVTIFQWDDHCPFILPQAHSHAGNTALVSLALNFRLTTYQQPSQDEFTPINADQALLPRSPDNCLDIALGSDRV